MSLQQLQRLPLATTCPSASPPRAVWSDSVALGAHLELSEWGGRAQSTQQGHAVAERAMEVAAGHTAAQATLQGTLLTPRSVSSVIGTLGDPGARAEMLLGVKLEMAGASKVVLDAKLALERMQLEYHHAILVEEATSAELQQLLERDMSAVELAKQLTQVRLEFSLTPAQSL